MNRVSIVVLMCLVAGASAAWFGSNGPDFDGLNKFLIAKVDKKGAKTNINVLKENLASLSGNIKEAAEISINFAEATECNENVLSNLVKLHAGGVTSTGFKRIEIVLKSHLNRAVKACVDYLDKEVETKVSDQFSNQVNSGLKLDTTLYLRPLYQKDRYHRNFFSAETIHNLVWKLAKADPNAKIDPEMDEVTGKRSQQVHKANTARAFDQQLVVPCQQYTSSHKDLFEGAEAIANFVGIGDFVDSCPRAFRAKAFTYVLCRTVQQHTGDLKKAAVSY